MIVSTGAGAGRQYGVYSWVIFKIILKSEENENDAWELRWVNPRENDVGKP